MWHEERQTHIQEDARIWTLTEGEGEQRMAWHTVLVGNDIVKVPGSRQEHEDHEEQHAHAIGHRVVAVA